MGVTAETVTIKFLADVDQQNAAIVGAERQFSSSTGKMAAAAADLETKATKSSVHVGQALKDIFNSSRLALVEEGTTKLRVFGSAIEPLGIYGVAAAAGLAVLFIGMEQVKKAAEEIGALKINADNLGVSVEGLQELQFAAKESHVPVEALNQSLLGLDETLGRLRAGETLSAGGRSVKLEDFLGFTPEEVAKYKNAADLIGPLADKIKALPTLSDQVAAAQNANALPLLPLLLKGKDGIAELTAEYRKLGVEVSGPTADGIEAGNLALERANDIAHEKVRNSLLGLQPVLVALSTGWDNFASAAVGAFSAINDAYQKYLKSGAEMAGRKNDPLANFAGHASLIFAQPASDIGALFGNRESLNKIWTGYPGGHPPSGAPGSTGQAQGAPGPTAGQIAAQVKATQQLDELNAKLVTHTSQRLEVETKLAEIAKEQGHPVDPATRQKLLKAADAEDAKYGTKQADTQTEVKKASSDAVLRAQDEELAARRALTQGVEAQLTDQLAAIEIDRQRKDADLNAQASEKKITASAAEQATTANDKAAGEKKDLAIRQAKWALEDRANALTAEGLQTLGSIAALDHDYETALKVRLAQILLAQKVADQATDHSGDDPITKAFEKITHARQAQADTAKAASDDAYRQFTDAQSATKTLDGIQTAHVEAVEGLAKTASARLAIEEQLLVIAQRQRDAELDAIINNPNTTPQQFTDALAEKQALPQATADKTAALEHAYHDTVRSGVLSGLEAAQGGAKSFAKFLGDTIKQNLAKSLADTITNALLGAAPGGKSTGGLGSDLAAFATDFLVPHFAGGTNSAPGGLSLVGERGPELVNLPKGAQVVPNHVLTAMNTRALPAGGGDSGPPQITQIFDNRGAVMFEKRAAELMQYSEHVANRAGQAAVATVNKNGPARLQRNQQLGA